MQAIFTLLPKPKRTVLGSSLRDTLAHARKPRTNVYNPSKSTYVNGLGVSEWAAVLTVGPHACRRCIPDILLLQSALNGHAVIATPLSLGLDLLSALRDLVCVEYYYPRRELDAGFACGRREEDRLDLQRLTALLLADVRAVCVRPDCATLARIIDMPNLHRLAEVAVHTVTWCGHI